MTFVSATPAQGSYDSATGLWTVGSLASGSNVNLHLYARYTGGYSGQPIVNTASVDSFGQADSVPANDSASATITPKTADLRVQISVSDSGPEEFQAIAYTVKVKNQGPAALATGVVISDVLPAGSAMPPSAPPRAAMPAAQACGPWGIWPAAWKPC